MQPFRLPFRLHSGVVSSCAQFPGPGLKVGETTAFSESFLSLTPPFMGVHRHALFDGTLFKGFSPHPLLIMPNSPGNLESLSETWWNLSLLTSTPTMNRVSQKALRACLEMPTERNPQGCHIVDGGRVRETSGTAPQKNAIDPERVALPSTDSNPHSRPNSYHSVTLSGSKEKAAGYHRPAAYKSKPATPDFVTVTPPLLLLQRWFGHCAFGRTPPNTGSLLI